jgi:transposase
LPHWERADVSIRGRPEGLLHREPIDFRAGINSLVTLVEQSMQLDPFARAVFAFHNRRRNRVKLLFYERTGFWLMLRRLEEDHFVWPRRQQAVIELTTEQLYWLLDGIDIDAVRRHRVRALSPFGVIAPGILAVMAPLETSNSRVRTGIKVA